MEDRGMGFISPTDGGDDVFVHRTMLVDGRSLVAGAPVMFEMGFDEKKGKKIAVKCSGAVNLDGAAGHGAPMGGGGPPMGGGFQPSMGMGQPQQGFQQPMMQQQSAPAPDASMQSPPESESLFISGLPPDMTEDRLRQIMSQYGSVQACTVMPPTGMPDCCALVRFADVAGAKWIVQNLNGNMPLGLSTPISVNFALPLDGAPAPSPAPAPQMGGMGGQQAPAMGGGFGGGGGAAEGNSNLFVAGLPQDIQEDRLRQIFAQYGGVASVKVLPSNGKDCAALVRMADETIAKWLVDNLHGNMPLGLSQPISVRFKKQDGFGGGGGGGGFPGGGGGFGGGAPPMQAMQMQGQPQQNPPPGERQATQGTVKTWLDDKGIGFIKPDSGGDDAFCHRNEITDGRALMQGARVNFELGFDAARGKRVAYKVTGGIADGGAPGGKGGGGMPGAAPGGMSDNLFVAGLPLDMTEDRLRQIFGQYGAVNSCKVLPSSGKQDLAALVRMLDPNQATWIVANLNGNIPLGLAGPLTVRHAQGKGKGKDDEKGFGKGGGGGFGKGGFGDQGQNFSSPYGQMAAAPQPQATSPGQFGLGEALAGLVGAPAPAQAAPMGFGDAPAMAPAAAAPGQL